MCYSGTAGAGGGWPTLRKRPSLRGTRVLPRPRREAGTVDSWTPRDVPSRAASDGLRLRCRKRDLTEVVGVDTQGPIRLGVVVLLGDVRRQLDDLALRELLLKPREEVVGNVDGRRAHPIRVLQRDGLPFRQVAGIADAECRVDLLAREADFDADRGIDVHSEGPPIQPRSHPGTTRLGCQIAHGWGSVPAVRVSLAIQGSLPWPTARPPTPPSRFASASRNSSSTPSIRLPFTSAISTTMPSNTSSTPPTNTRSTSR